MSDNYSTDSFATIAKESTNETTSEFSNATTTTTTNKQTVKFQAWNNFIDGFKRNTNGENNSEDGDNPDIEKQAGGDGSLKKTLKNRHIQMIAIGGSIGTGLFVGSGAALSSGGPASLIICYFLVSTMIFTTVQALGELSVTFPISGSFLALNTRFLSPAWGFCMSWNYLLQWLIALPLELVACAMTMKYWNDEVNPAIWVTIFLLMIALINLFGVKGFAEVEFSFSVIKIIAVIGFCVLGVVINLGGGGSKTGHIGGKFWHEPGAFNNGFNGFCSVFVTAAFSFSGTELIGMTSAETENPRKTLPKATKQVFWRITIFYMVSLTIIGLLVPFNDPRLIGNSEGSGAEASPFVIAVRNAGIGVFPSIMNAVILIAVLSVANSSVFATSRTLTTLAKQNFIPSIFGYIDNKGRPLIAILTALAFGGLGYLSVCKEQGEIFSWLMALSGLSSIFTWLSICLVHIRFRQALKFQGRSVNELVFKSMSGVIGSWWGVFLNIIILIFEMFTAMFPDFNNLKHIEIINFFKINLNLFCLLGMIIIYVLWKGRKGGYYIKLEDIDIDSGRREENMEELQEIIKQEREELAAKMWIYRVYHLWC